VIACWEANEAAARLDWRELKQYRRALLVLARVCGGEAAAFDVSRLEDVRAAMTSASGMNDDRAYFTKWKREPLERPRRQPPGHAHPHRLAVSGAQEAGAQGRVGRAASAARAGRDRPAGAPPAPRPPGGVGGGLCPHPLADDAGDAPPPVAERPWFKPSCCRHGAKQMLTRELGLDTARSILGRKSLDGTNHYAADADLSQAVDAARRFS
jgi:hypothetical protein